MAPQYNRAYFHKQLKHIYCIFSKLEFWRSGENYKENTVKMLRKETS